MSDEARELYNKVISFWPKELDVSQKELHENGGATIPELSKVHDEVESKVLDIDNSERKLECMDWAIFTVLHIKAREEQLLKVNEIEFSSVLEYYNKNISNL